MKIILMGYMGSGKSGVGKQLAQQLNLPFKDLDQEITTAENNTISKIFETSGEIGFRKKEREMLHQLLDSENGYVLALGGGTPCYGNNLDLIKETDGVNLVYLKTSLDELTRRLFKERNSRPLISHLQTRELLEDFIRKHLFERSFYYSQANIVVDTDGKTIQDIASEVEGRLQ